MTQTTIRAVEYASGDAERWDEFVRRSTSGTFLHERRYLSYHGERFVDRSLLIETSAGEVVGVLPAAESGDPRERRVVSHPGITFGGLVYDRQLRGERLLDAFRLLTQAFRDRGYRTLDYRPVPWFFRTTVEEEDRYALFRQGASVNRSHLTAVVDLRRRGKTGPNYHYDVRRARRDGVDIVWEAEFESFWPILEQELDRRYGTSPVHGLDEMSELARRFPEAIRCVVAKVGEQVVAGAVLYEFRRARVVHTQYLASTPDGRRLRALHLLCEEVIAEAIRSEHSFVSFGGSTEDGGHRLNQGLYDFKYSSGASGVPLEAYDLTLCD